MTQTNQNKDYSWQWLDDILHVLAANMWLNGKKLIHGGKDKEVAQAEIAIQARIDEHYIGKGEAEQAVIQAFKASTYLNVDGDAKYWSAEGDYNKTATDKFFPQDFLEEKLLPNFRKQLSTNNKDTLERSE